MLNARKVGEKPEIQKPIFYLEHPVGSGKTEAVLVDIANRPDDSFIYVCPTIDLSDEIGNRLLEKGRHDIRELNSSTMPRGTRSVVKWALGEINGKRRDEHRVFIVTTETFVDILAELDDWTKSQFHVFVDEGLDPVKTMEFSTKELDIFRPYFEIDGAGKFAIAKGHKGNVEDLLRNKRALAGKGLGHLDVKEFREICELIDGPTYDVFGEINDNAIEVIGFLNPQTLMPFASLTFIVAIFNQSVLALCLRELHQADLREFQLDFPFFDTHRECGRRMEVFHLLNAADNASLANLSKPVPEGGGQRVVDRIAEIAAERLRGVKYCWTVNNKYEPDIKGILGDDGYMPMQCHGLNAYKERTAVAMLGCKNPTPWQRPILKAKLHLDDDELHELWNLSPVYQAIGRCAIRDRESNADITVVVLSRREAERLAKIFEGAKFQGQLGDLPRLGKQNAAIGYTKADNSAYSKYRMRCLKAGNDFLQKDEWHEKIRKPQLAQ